MLSLLRSRFGLLAGAFSVMALPNVLHAQTTFYGTSTPVTPVYTPALPDDGDAMAGFDVAANGDLYYSYGNYAQPLAAVSRYNAASNTATNLYTTASGGGDYVADVTVHTSSAGEYAYFLRDNFPSDFSRINTSTTALSNQQGLTVSTFAGHGDGMFISGGAFGSPTNLYYAPIKSDGGLDTPTALTAGLNGGSGPIAFNAAGDLYYAPGYSDKEIYKWSAAEVAAAISPSGSKLLDPTGHVWLDYTGNLGLAADDGATGLTIDDKGNLFATITSFTDASVLAQFDVSALGDYAGTTLLASSTDRLGDVRYDSLTSQVLFNNGSSIFAIPEPASMAALLLIGGGLLRRRR